MNQRRAVFIVILIVVCFAQCQSSPSLAPMMFVFGDSFVDSGNNNYLNTTAHANHFPYGINFENGVATGRWCDGRIIPDYLAGYLRITSPPSYLDHRNVTSGANFGSAGSGILNTTHIGGQVLTFTDQLNCYEEHRRTLDDTVGVRLASYLTAKSIFYINIGNNDVNSYIESHDGNTIPPDFRSYLLLQMQHKIQRMYELGARKIILTSTYALGCAPFYQNQGRCNQRALNTARYYNSGVLDLMRNLQSTLSDLFIVYANTYQVMVEVHQDPLLYGIRNVTHACCPTTSRPADPWCYSNDDFCTRPSTFLFWDTAHPTETFNRIAAQRFWNGPQRYIFPINVQTLSQL